jgi:hypothetical protein
MGLGPPVLSLFKFLYDQDLFSTVNAVAELGSQEYDTKIPEYDAFLTRFLQGAGADTPQERDSETGRLRGPARDFFTRLGCSYLALDIDGRFGSLPFDLNFDRLPDELRSSADLTTNFGTTEHVFNQLGCFTTIHDLTRLGGYMLHALPLHNYINHGLFSYSPSFFEALAVANEYELLGMWMAPKTSPNRLPPAHPPFPSTRTLLISLLKRTSEEDFKMPLQLSNPMFVHDSLGGRYKATERRLVGTTTVRYAGTIVVDLDTMSSLLEPDHGDAALTAGVKRPKTKVKKKGKAGGQVIASRSRSLLNWIRESLAKVI